jgi:hypothetical protein
LERLLCASLVISQVASLIVKHSRDKIIRRHHIRTGIPMPAPDIHAECDETLKYDVNLPQIYMKKDMGMSGQ